MDLGDFLIGAIFFSTFLVLFFAARARHRGLRIALAILAFIPLVIQGGLLWLGKEINDGFSGSNSTSTLMGWMLFACVIGTIYSLVLMFTRGNTERDTSSLSP